MSPIAGFVSRRLVSTRWLTLSVGTIEALGMRKGLTTNAWISSASATAIATVRTSSISPFIARRPRLQDPDPVRWPVREHRLADDPLPRDRAPVAAVLRVRAVVAHHVVGPAGDGDRLGERARAGTRAGDGVGILLGHAVADDLPVADRQAIAGQPHHALDERRRRGPGGDGVARAGLILADAVLPLVGIGAPRVVVGGMEDHDVADLRGVEVGA